MPLLTFDRKVPLAEQRLKVALSQSVRHKGKKHAVGKRNAAIKRAAKAAGKAKADANLKRAREIRAATHAYWSGEKDTCP